MIPEKSIVVIQTPASSIHFTQVTCLMSDEEFEEAKKERPDLVMFKANELPEQLSEASETTATIKEEVDDETRGITVRGMTLPHNLEQLVEHLFQKE